MLNEAQYKILQPLVYTTRLFGLCPVAFVKVGNSYKLKYVPLLVLYSYALVTVFGISSILGIRTDMDAGSNAVRMKSKKTKYISVCDMSVVFIIALLGLVLIPYRMRWFTRMLDIWSSVDAVIPITNYKKFRNHSVFFLTASVLLTTVLFLFDIFIYCFQWRVSNNPTFYLQNYVGYYMLYYVLVFQEIFFWHLVFFIHIRIVSLNENLIAEKNNMKMGLKKLFIVSGLSRVEKKGFGEVAKFGKYSADRILELLKTFGKIKESVEILNNSFSFGVVLIMLSCLLHLVVTPYFLLLEIFKEKISWVFLSLQGVWFLAHFGRLLIMVEPCQKCLEEYKITQTLISDLVLMDFDKETRELLQNFTTQFSYAELKFHACGFFNIDRNLLTSVAAAVTTYLVILFQFNGQAD